MSISDMIVVMKEGVVQQIGRPQQVYDEPVNLFVAKFLGTPPINVFAARVRNGQLCIGGQPVLPVGGVPDREVWTAIRPEGFVPAADGALCCALGGVEVMGRDISVVASHPDCANTSLRAIVSAENLAGLTGDTVRFTLKPSKVLLFDKDSEERITFPVQG